MAGDPRSVVPFPPPAAPKVCPGSSSVLKSGISTGRVPPNFLLADVGCAVLSWFPYLHHPRCPEQGRACSSHSPSGADGCLGRALCALGRAGRGEAGPREGAREQPSRLPPAAGPTCRVAWAGGGGTGGTLGGPLRADLPAQGTPRVSRSPGAVGTERLRGEPASGARGSLGAGQETPGGAFVFPSTSGLRKLLARLRGCQRGGGGLSDGGCARPGFPACPGTGPAEGARVGGGRGRGLGARALSPPAVRNRQAGTSSPKTGLQLRPRPRVPSAGSRACPPGKGAQAKGRGLQREAGVAQSPESLGS